MGVDVEGEGEGAHGFVELPNPWKGYDVTSIPTQLDEALDLLDPEGALRAATLRAQTSEWKRTFRASLLSPPTEEMLHKEQVRGHKNQAFDLLDALSRSGLMAFDHCQVHVLMVTSHLFDRSLMDTLICRNVNPIDPLSRSAYIVASVLHGHPAPSDLLSPTHHASLLASWPALFPAPPSEEEDKNPPHENQEEKEDGKKEEEKEVALSRSSSGARVSNAEVVSKIEAKLARLAQASQDE